MRRRFRILAGGLAIAVLLILLLAWDDSGWYPIPFFCGQREARADIATGQFMVLSYGLVDRSRSEYGALLRQRYGVEVHTVAGCIVSKSTHDYVAAYNGVSVAAANRKFGHDIFKEADDQELKDRDQTTATGTRK